MLQTYLLMMRPALSGPLPSPPLHIVPFKTSEISHRLSKGAIRENFLPWYCYPQLDVNILTI